MYKDYFKKFVTILIFVLLLVLTFFLLKPILLSILMGIVLAFIFYPLYSKLYKLSKSKNFAAFLICIAIILLIAIPLWFLTPVFVNQSVKIYVASQQIDFVGPLKHLFPFLFTSEIFSAQVESLIYAFVTKITSSLTIAFSDLIMSFPNLFLQSLIILFILFFTLKDQDKFVDYIHSLLPFSKEVKNKLIKSSKDLTTSVLYGQILLGIVGGTIAGIGFFIFKIPNALILSLFATITAVFPIVGTTLVWVPVMIYCLVVGNTFAAIGILFFGLLSSTVIENFIKPNFISRRTNLNPPLVLIGMIGGILLFGILGIILGPLILAYLLIILEVYQRSKVPNIFLTRSKRG
jgi:predicted PurR-regulated permease PerM